MIKVKHLMDEVERDDGARLWVEPVGLTRDLCEWCVVDHLLLKVAPPRRLAKWFDKHPLAYEHFRGRYHEYLSRSKFLPALEELARAASSENYTLLHSGDDPQRNIAKALAEFLCERQGWFEATK